METKTWHRVVQCKLAKCKQKRFSFWLPWTFPFLSVFRSLFLSRSHTICPSPLCSLQNGYQMYNNNLWTGRDLTFCRVCTSFLRFHSLHCFTRNSSLSSSCGDGGVIVVRSFAQTIHFHAGTDRQWKRERERKSAKCDCVVCCPKAIVNLIPIYNYRHFVPPFFFFSPVPLTWSPVLLPDF